MQQHALHSTKSSNNYSSLVDAQYSAPPVSLENDIDAQAQLNQLRERAYREWPKSKYSDVSVLLLRWAADNLGVIKEVIKLGDLFRDRFNFSVEIWDIPSEDPEDELTRKILEFRRGRGRGSLILLYYAGHGDGNPRECIWAANTNQDSPCLNWHNVQGHLLGHPCDTLFVLDCCYASLAASPHNTGDNWLLGASVKESEATGVSWKSFTSAMTRSLERAANKYWTDRKKYSLHSLSYELNLWERDLPVTPNFVPLNEHHCEPTDLTPLLYARARPVLASARTEPVASQTHETPRMPSLPHHPRKDYAMLSVGSPVPFSRRSDGQEGSQTDMIPIEISVMEDCQTLRISGLPRGTVAEDVTDGLRGFQVPGLANMQPGPIAQHPPSGTNTMTITLPSIALAKQVLELGGEEFRNQSGRLGNQLTMDMNFMGLTTIYSSPEGPHQEPNVDIVFVHGAYGHPINSFASHYVSSPNDQTSHELCWPRDELPGLLETSGVFPRVMVYGWRADVWLSPHGNVSSFADDFRTQLRNARIAAPQRPLVFFGHGLGGILIKEAVNNTIYSDIQEGYFETSVRLCCFLATPHRAYRDQDFASVLTAMKTLLNSKPAVVRPQRLEDLKGRNHALENISSEFDALRQEYGISLLSAGEFVRTQDHIIVPEECAIFSGTTKDRINLDCNYNDLARLPKTSVNRDNGLRHMSGRIIEQLKPSHHHTLDDAKVAKKREKVYGRLRKYDTVFLVDDSGSMYGRRWYTASKALADTAAIAVRYDTDGIDVKFFNEPLEGNEGKNITSSERVMELFTKIHDFDGPTLTADLLEAELNEYMYHYDQNRSRRGLNLIILTDGEPEKGQDVERVIIKYANQLRDARAPLFHVGIQFVQIGADSAATEFLRRLDSKLKDTHNLDRDMVDTVHWVPGDEGRLFEKILLGGILKQLDDEDEFDHDS